MYWPGSSPIGCPVEVAVLASGKAGGVRGKLDGVEGDACVDGTGPTACPVNCHVNAVVTYRPAPDGIDEINISQGGSPGWCCQRPEIAAVDCFDDCAQITNSVAGVDIDEIDSVEGLAGWECLGGPGGVGG